MLVLSLAGAAWFWPAASTIPREPDPLVGSTVGRTLATVHVSGAVGAPGLVEVPVGSRVADAIAAAGGLLPRADASMLNLAAPVQDGEQIRVAGVSVTPSEGTDRRSGDGLVHVNTADAGELQQLPGVGPVLADRIVAFRESEGPFGAVEDLLDVPGIGEGKLAALREAVAIP